jgi:hypothetical protein
MIYPATIGGHLGCDHMVVEFTTIYAISTYHDSSLTL